MLATLLFFVKLFLQWKKFSFKLCNSVISSVKLFPHLLICFHFVVVACKHTYIKNSCKKDDYITFFPLRTILSFKRNTCTAKLCNNKYGSPCSFKRIYFVVEHGLKEISWCCSVNRSRVVIVNHQNIGLGKFWKPFWATLNNIVVQIQ